MKLYLWHSEDSYEKIINDFLDVELSEELSLFGELFSIGNHFSEVLGKKLIFRGRLAPG